MLLIVQKIISCKNYILTINYTYKIPIEYKTVVKITYRLKYKPDTVYP